MSLKGIIDWKEKWKVRLRKLEGLDERWIHTFEHLKAYQRRAKKSYGINIIPREFQVGDLVLKENHHKSQAKNKDKGNLEIN